MRRIALMVCSVVGVALLALLFSVSAFAEAPWWRLYTGARPTYLKSGVARDEVRKLTVHATSGSYYLEEPIEVVASNFNEGYVQLPFNAGAFEIQLALETLYGAGNVEVTEVGAGEFTIAFGAALADRHVPLTAEGEVTIGEVIRGQPDGELYMTAENMGDQNLSGASSPVTLTDVLPPGVTAVAVEGSKPVAGGDFTKRLNLPCRVEEAGRRASCTMTSEAKPQGRFSQETLASFEELEMHIAVIVGASAVSGEQNEVSVSGGEGYSCQQGASGKYFDSGCVDDEVAGGRYERVPGGAVPPASIRRPVMLSGEPVPFGVEGYALEAEEEGGAPVTQAGEHPFQLTASITLNQDADLTPPGSPVEGAEQKPHVVPAGIAKDLRLQWPAGLIGNPTPFVQCTDVQFFKTAEGGASNFCPAQSAVGMAAVTVNEPSVGGFTELTVPLFNLVPRVGEPARFGFFVALVNTPVVIDTAIRAGRDYGITVEGNNITQSSAFISAKVTVWGVPGDPRHAHQRGWQCMSESEGRIPSVPCDLASERDPPPFLSMPTSCSGALSSTIEGDSWVHPGSLATLAEASMPGLDGCNRVPFGSTLSVVPDGQEGSSPTGLSVGIHVSQDSTLDPKGLTESAVRDTTVALPVGVQISPGAADGLLACSDAQVGFTGVEPAMGMNQFTPGPAGCPNASKVGTVEIKTPLLPEPVEGGVYLAAQNQNPFGSLIALYLDAENQNEGVNVKLAGEVKLDEQTGQLVAMFPGSPQVPFEEARLHFFGGVRAPLSTPPLCGSYTSVESIAPWSGNPPSKATSTFQITTGPNGSACASPRPFQPGFQAGTTSVQAGGFSPLTMTMTRPDADQQLGRLNVVFPPGISAGLRGVRLCEEPQAASGDCRAESEIGQVIVSAGLGGNPFSVETGKAYITGSYDGAPFGVDVVVPAVAGPFNLGTEVVRSRVEVDPTDAHLTVVSDKFPTILDGIPLQIQHVNVTVNRQGFVFNPTSCEPMRLTGQLESIEGATANVATPFQVTNCAALSFAPEFKVSTEARTSRTEGATLHVKLTLPGGAQGTKANVKEVKVSLPKALPSPLKTLQKACTEKRFAENPSNCPTASRVGEAHVTTPVLEGGLKGPAYFVSHGGAKYPELIMVLTGEDGVTVQVHGETFISKQGITTATFSTVPDVPFSTFELELPKREYPALSANGNLCQAQSAGKLLMPTEMVGQNGYRISQSTKIAVTGCPKGKKKAAHSKKKAKHASRGKVT